MDDLDPNAIAFTVRFSDTLRSSNSYIRRYDFSKRVYKSYNGSGTVARTFDFDDLRAHAQINICYLDPDASSVMASQVLAGTGFNRMAKASPISARQVRARVVRKTSTVTQ